MDIKFKIKTELNNRNLGHLYINYNDEDLVHKCIFTFLSINESKYNNLKPIYFDSMDKKTLTRYRQPMYKVNDIIKLIENK